MQGVDRLVGQHLIIRHIHFLITTVVVSGVAEKQKVLRLMSVCGSIIDRLHKPAVCRSVRRTRREFIVNLLRSDYQC